MAGLGPIRYECRSNSHLRPECGCPLAAILQINAVPGEKTVVIGSFPDQFVSLGQSLFVCKTAGPITCELVRQATFDLGPYRRGKNCAGFEVHQSQAKPLQALILEALNDGETIRPCGMVKRDRTPFVIRPWEAVIDSLLNMRR